eukprot:SAG11_NODE_10710_length_810_cov_1.607595_2_plen_80_part_01
MGALHGAVGGLMKVVASLGGLFALGLVAPGVDGHSSLIYPKPRNAIDSLLPEWSGGKAPYRWEKVKANPLGDYPCACVNG